MRLLTLINTLFLLLLIWFRKFHNNDISLLCFYYYFHFINRNITEAKAHDRYGLKQLIFPKDTIIVKDRAYFDFELMLNRIKAENVFVTRIKTNTLCETVEELELPDYIDQNILKDEIICLNSSKAKEIGISEHKLRLVHVYKEDENKVIAIITNQLD